MPEVPNLAGRWAPCSRSHSGGPHRLVRLTTHDLTRRLNAGYAGTRLDMVRHGYVLKSMLRLAIHQIVKHTVWGVMRFLRINCKNDIENVFDM